jgi:VWFA-related protein
MRQSAWWLPVCAISIFGGLATAQTAPNAPPAAEPGATIRTTATEVMLDVVVVDKHGKNVRTLKQGDVDVYEDGVKQPVTSFRLVGARELPAAQTTAPAARTAGTSEISRPLRAVNMVCIVYHNISPVSHRNAILAVQEFLKNEMPPDTYIGMFLLSDRLTPILGFTNDRAKVSQAAEHAFNLSPLDFTSASVGVLTANPNLQTITITGSATGGGGASLTIAGGELANTVIAGADVTNAPGAERLRGAQVTENRDLAELTGARAEDQIDNLIKTLSALPGRKTVLMVTQGLLTTGEPERLQAMLTKAIANGVTLYPLDITGLTETSTAQAANLKLGAVANQSANQANVTTMQGTMSSSTSASGVITSTAINLDAMKEQSRQGDTLAYGVRASDTQASLRALAEGTGGFMIANSQDYAKPFARILDNVQAHYELVYRPTENKYDGRLRKIQVKLNGRAADYHVESRTGYFAMPDLKSSGALQPFEILGLSVLSSNPEPHAFDFHAAAFRFRNESANARAELYFELPGDALKAVAGADRTHEMHASLVALVKDSTGQVVDKYSSDQTYRLPDDKLKDLMAVPIEYTHPVNLPAGHYTVEAAVLDREAGRASTSVTQFDNAETKGFGLSGIMVIRRVDPVGKPDLGDPLAFAGKHLVPLLSSTLHSDTPYMLYFEVYPDRSSMKRLAAQVEVSSGGKVLESKPAKLTWDAGAWKALVEAPAQVGSYQVKVTASQGSLSAEAQTFQYTVVK